MSTDYMYAPHCAKCGIQVGAPRLVLDDYKPVRTLCFTCPGDDVKPKADDDERQKRRTHFEMLQMCISEEYDLEQEMNSYPFPPAFSDEWGDYR